MKKDIVDYSIINGEKLYATSLKTDSGIELNGEFNLTPFDYLSKEQLQFALVFIKNQGNIKMIEKQLNISYPTVKKNLDELCLSLGFKAFKVDNDVKPTRESVKEKLKNGEITFEEAEDMLGGL